MKKHYIILAIVILSLSQNLFPQTGNMRSPVYSEGTIFDFWQIGWDGHYAMRFNYGYKDSLKKGSLSWWDPANLTWKSLKPVIGKFLTMGSDSIPRWDTISGTGGGGFDTTLYATASNTGYLKYSDWSLFNLKQSAISNLSDTSKYIEFSDSSSLFYKRNYLDAMFNSKQNTISNIADTSKYIEFSDSSSLFYKRAYLDAKFNSKQNVIPNIADTSKYIEFSDSSSLFYKRAYLDAALAGKAPVSSILYPDGTYPDMSVGYAEDAGTAGFATTAGTAAYSDSTGKLKITSQIYKSQVNGLEQDLALMQQEIDAKQNTIPNLADTSKYIEFSDSSSLFYKRAYLDAMFNSKQNTISNIADTSKYIEFSDSSSLFYKRAYLDAKFNSKQNVIPNIADTSKYIEFSDSSSLFYKRAYLDAMFNTKQNTISNLADTSKYVEFSDSAGVYGWYRRAYIDALMNLKESILSFSYPLSRSGNTISFLYNSTHFGLSSNQLTANQINASTAANGFQIGPVNLGGTFTLTTPQDLRTTASPQFAGALFTGNVSQSGNYSYYNNYVTGWAGSGWRIDQGITVPSKSSAEFDNLTVRGTMSIYELLIRQIRATNGNLFVTASAKADSVYGTDSTVIRFENPTDSSFCPFKTGDLLLAQRFYNTDTLRILRKVSVTVDSVKGRVAYISYRDSSHKAVTGLEFVRIGSTSDSTRRSSIYLASDDNNAPFIDMISGINSWAAWDTTSKTKLRLGNLYGITDSLFGGALNGYGLYAQNVYLKGNIQMNSGAITWANVNEPTKSDLGTWTTYIDANGIYTGTLTANQVNAVNVIADSAVSGIYLVGQHILGGDISIGSGNSIFKADANGIYLGNATFASAPFRVTPAGVITATSGTIGGWALNSTSLSSGDVTLNAADKYLQFGTALVEDDPSGSGIYLGWDPVNDAHTFFVGNTAGSYLYYNYAGTLAVNGGSFTAPTLTGGTVQTASSGQRVVMASNQLSFYDASGAVGNLKGSDGALYFDGTYFKVGKLIANDISLGQATNIGAGQGGETVVIDSLIQASKNYLSSDGSEGGTKAVIIEDIAGQFHELTFKSGLFIRWKIDGVEQ